MSTQQQPRPWFRLAGMVRPAPAPAPAPAPPPPLARPPAPTTPRQAPPPISPFRPPMARPRPLAPAAASPPPATRAPPNLPIASPSSVTPTSPRSPQITRTGAPPPPAPSPSPKSPKSPVPPPPAAAAASITRSPIATPAPPPKPESPIVKSSSLSPPKSPIIKAASAEMLSAAPPMASSSSLPASPKMKLASPPSSTTTLPASPASKTLLYSKPPNTAAAPVPPPPSPVAATEARPRAAPSPGVKQPSWEKSSTHPPDQVQSTFVKPLSHPPSPLTLPPPQLKADATGHNYDLEPIPPEAVQKTVLTQDDTNHEKAPKINLTKPSSSPSSAERERQAKKDKGSMTTYKDKKNHHKSDVSSPEYGMRVVTLAGDNKGAVMELSPAASRKKCDSRQHFGSNIGHRLGSGEKEEEGGKHYDDGGIKNGKDGKGRSRLMRAAQAPMDAFVNSNVQGVNNSIVYNSTYNNRDPGVHLSVYRKGNGHHQQEDDGHYNVHRD